MTQAMFKSSAELFQQSCLQHTLLELCSSTCCMLALTAAVTVLAALVVFSYCIVQFEFCYSTAGAAHVM